jgi:hypothetical protein
MTRDGYTQKDAEDRIHAQMPLEEKCQLADYVIDNNSNSDDMEVGVRHVRVCRVRDQAVRQQARRIYDELRQSNFHWRLRLTLVGGLALVALAVCQLHTIVAMIRGQVDSCDA